MNARALNALAGVICRAQENGKQTPMGIAIAVESAGLLQSPESAAELEQLRSERASTNAALADVTTAQRAGEFALGGMTRACDSILAERNELRERVAELEAASHPAILDLPPSRVTRRALAQMVTEDPHDSPLHHSYRVARDLPGGVS